MKQKDITMLDPGEDKDEDDQTIGRRDDHQGTPIQAKNPGVLIRLRLLLPHHLNKVLLKVLLISPVAI